MNNTTGCASDLKTIDILLDPLVPGHEPQWNTAVSLWNITDKSLSDNDNYRFWDSFSLIILITCKQFFRVFQYFSIFCPLFRIRTNGDRYANKSLFGSNLMNGFAEFVLDSVWFIWTVHSCTESVFIKQKPKQKEQNEADI